MKMILDFLKSQIIGITMWQFLLVIAVVVICLIFLIINMAKSAKRKDKKKDLSSNEYASENMQERLEGGNQKVQFGNPIGEKESCIDTPNINPAPIKNKEKDLKPENKVKTPKPAPVLAMELSEDSAQDVVIKKNDSTQNSEKQSIIKRPKQKQPKAGKSIIKRFETKIISQPEEVKFADSEKPKNKPEDKPSKAEQSNISAEVKGKYMIDIKLDGYHFYLIANNGQLLFDNPGFTTPEGAEKGIETFKSAVKEGDFYIYEDKYKRFRYILNNRYVGENYSTRKACENSMESVKRFALVSPLVEYESNPKMEKKYEEIKKSVKSFKDIDWEKVFSQPVQPSGKFEIAKEKDGFHFYLIANNGQLLYTSKKYASKATVKNGIESFKKAAYVGNFYVDDDKFERYRYILKGGNYSVTYLGESYTTKQAAVSSIESVKRFAMSAVIKEAEEE